MQSVFVVVTPDGDEVEFVLPMHRPIGGVNDFVTRQLGFDPARYRLQDDTTRYILPLGKTLADYFPGDGGVLRLRHSPQLAIPKPDIPPLPAIRMQDTPFGLGDVFQEETSKDVWAGILLFCFYLIGYALMAIWVANS